MLNRYLLNLIIVTLFFDAQVYSFYLFGARIRPVQVVGLIGFLLVLAASFLGKVHFRRTFLDLPLWCYLGVNFLAILGSRQLNRSLKIAILLISLVILYYLVVALIPNREVFDRAFRFLLLAGVVEIGFGLYQVAAGLVNILFKIRLPVGHLGVFHADYIGAPWGRPYGTFVEPDWYGAVCLFFATVFLVLYFNKPERKTFHLLGLVLSLSGLFLSFVRAAWGGFLFALIFLFIFRKKAEGVRLRPAVVLKTGHFAAVILLFAVALLPPLQTIVQKRFFPSTNVERFTTRDIRIHAIEESFWTFLDSPIIGHGPGTEGEVMSFNPSIVMTALQDTGILGLFFLIFLLWRFFAAGLRRVSCSEGAYQPQSFALIAGLAGLFLTYVLTSGLWLPFTWIFMAITVAALSIGRAAGSAPERPMNQERCG